MLLRQKQSREKMAEEAKSLRNVHGWCTDKSLHVGTQVCYFIQRWLEDHGEFQVDMKLGQNET